MASPPPSRETESTTSEVRNDISTTQSNLTPLAAPQWLCSIALALIALTPLFRHWNDFAALFWLGDDLVVLDDLAHRGFGPWLMQLFAENFLPVFKLFWAAALYGGHAHYIVLIAACWVTHAINVGLLAAWLFRNGFSYFAVALVALVFGLSASNIETLGWAIQWSPVLSTLFLLVAFHLWTTNANDQEPPSVGRTVVLMFACAASALSFARGILSGIVVGRMWLFDHRHARAWGRHAFFVVAVMVPCLISAIVVLKNVPRDTALMTSGDPHHWRRALDFAGWYLGLNPLPHLLFGFFPKVTGANATCYVAIKVGLIAAGLVSATAPQRRVLFTLLLLEFGYAAQLGLGRWSLDSFLAMSSRYQYMSLLCFFPFVGIAADRVLHIFGEQKVLRTATAAASLAVAAWGANRLWAKLLPDWAEWRGKSSRRALFEASPNDPPPTMIGGVSPENARRLTQRFGLR